MVRRSAGFVSKKSHRKSRNGCVTCKRKKVKCDESRPTCGYCSLRLLRCDYPTSDAADYATSHSSKETSLSPTPVSATPWSDADFNNTNVKIRQWLRPAANTATGQLTLEDFELLHHYKTSTWQMFTMRQDPTVYGLHRDILPQLSISANYLLYALLSISASHSNQIQPSRAKEQCALMYRQKTFQEYTKALGNITSENYETVLATATFLIALVPPPSLEADDEEHIQWMYGLLKMAEGLRFLASLRWAQGIEKMSIYPLIRRELRSLPPPPGDCALDKHGLQSPPGPLGTTPNHPNPAPTYGIAFALPFANPVFLPPSLFGLFENILKPEDTGPIDMHRNTLIPAFRALSPIFLSLYYHHLNSDFYVRAVAYTSFLTPEFLALVKTREPRALTVIVWWFSLANLVPNGWWIGSCVRRVAEAMGKTIKTNCDESTMIAFNTAARLVAVFETQGREEAAKAVFNGWASISWEEGLAKAKEWESSLMVELDVDLNESTLSDLDLDMPGLEISV